MPFRMALFGAGKWSRNIVRALEKCGGVKIEAVLVRDLDKPRDGMKGVPAYDSPDALLAKHALDGVIICTPPASHAELCLKALDHRVPCFLEKPATTSLADMRRIQTRAEGLGLPVVVDYIHLYSAPFEHLLREIKDRPRPRKIIALAGNTTATPRDCSILWDWGPHDLAMCLACLGPGPTTVEQLDTWPRHTERFDTARLRLDWNGIPVRIRFSQALPRKARAFIVQFENDVLLYTDLPTHTLSRWPRRPGSGYRQAGAEILSSGGANPLSVALDFFIDRARKRIVNSDGLSSSVELTRILELCDRQLST